MLVLQGVKLCFVLVPLLSKLSWSNAHKTRSWYLLGVSFKISDKHLRLCYVRVPSPDICYQFCQNVPQAGDFATCSRLLPVYVALVFAYVYFVELCFHD